MPPSPAIEIEHLDLAPGGRPLLRQFSLRVEEGEKILLAGPSGCGKSTLLACLLGFALPAAGRIAVFGQPLLPRSAWTLRRRMALVQQEPDLGQQTAREWLEEPFAFAANAPLRPNLARIPALFDRLRLPAALLDQKGSQLSGGEKQRLALISALLLDRPLLLLDEPTSALDPDSRQAVYDCLASLDRQTLLIVSHDAGPGLAFATRTVRLASPETPHGRP